MAGKEIREHKGLAMNATQESRHEACAVCGQANIIIDTTTGFFLSLPNNIHVVKCRDCGLRWLHPMKTSEEYVALYQSSYFEELPENYEDVVARRVPFYIERLNKIKNIVGKAPSDIKLLDVGAATGDFVNLALRSGFIAAGIEPSREACTQARSKYGIELIQGDFLDANLDDQSFDVIHLNHVLEHIVAPHEIIEKIYERLSKNGLAVIEVPYQFGNFIQTVGRTLRLIDPIEFSIYSVHHPFFYSPESLRLLLVSHGFTVLEMVSWLPYLKQKLREARNYCKARLFLVIEQYIRLGHVIWKDMGKSHFIIAFARKISI